SAAGSALWLVAIPAPTAIASVVTAAVMSAVAVASFTRLVALLGGPGSDGDRDDRAWRQRAAGLDGQYGAGRLRRRRYPRQARPHAQPAQVGDPHAGLLARQAGAADQHHRRWLPPRGGRDRGARR